MRSVQRPRLVIVAGFLGAGKTSLLLAAAARLRSRGRHVGMITNDQGSELVDTRLLEATGLRTAEVTGGCLCCRFSDFVRSAGRLLDTKSGHGPEVIFAEPVGSCTDLSATILQPMKRFCAGRFALAPLTVLVDPDRAGQLLAPDASANLSYLFRKQLAEADLVWFTKADRYRRFPELPGIFARPLSARTGAGVDEWLKEVLAESGGIGARLAEVDYGRYAEAEAALGWANWRAAARLSRPLTPAAVIGPLLDRLDRALTHQRVAIAHLKILAESATGNLRASICRNGEVPSVDGPLDAPPASRHELLLNLRAEAAPELLKEAVAQAAAELPGRIRVLHQQFFRPHPPVPEHRFSEVV